jgi:hypothetical protein
LVNWARAIGVVRLRVGELELELGPDPVVPAEADPAAEKIAAHQAQREELRERLNVEFGHVGGWEGTDAQLDKILRGEARL